MNSAPVCTKPVPGEFRITVGVDEEMTKLVLVIASLREDCSLVTLVSEDTYLATHRDVLVEEDEWGGLDAVIIETDICVPLWNHQLSFPVGKLAEKLNGLLQPRPDLDSLPDGPRHGIALSGPEDSRWKWKELELERMNRLSADCYCALCGISD